MVEPKSDTKKRLGRSPDRADAVLMAFAEAGSSEWGLICYMCQPPHSLIGPDGRAVALADFTARSGKTGTTLRWRTASETEILGFNVWRYRGAKGVKVNRALIRAKRSGRTAGAAYSFVDRIPGAKRGLTYRLQLVDLKGKRTWYAAFAIASK